VSNCKKDIYETQAEKVHPYVKIIGDSCETLTEQKNSGSNLTGRSCTYVVAANSSKKSTSIILTTALLSETLLEQLKSTSLTAPLYMRAIVYVPRQ
jgi:hypothetical protein